MADPKTPAEIAAAKAAPDKAAVEQPTAAAQPKAIVLNKHYSWFGEATKNSPAPFIERNAGEEINDPDEIAYFIGINADFTAAA